MPKKILFESAIHHLTRAAKRRTVVASGEQSTAISTFMQSLSFRHLGKQRLGIEWGGARPGRAELDYRGAELYVRGDNPAAAKKQHDEHLAFNPDTIQQKNQELFDDAIAQLLEWGGVLATGVRCEALSRVEAGGAASDDSAHEIH